MSALATPRREVPPSPWRLLRPGLAARRVSWAAVAARWQSAFGVVSGRAWVLLALAVGCGVASLGTGWIELRVAALALVGCLVGAAVLTLGRSAYDVTVGLHSPRVVVGQRSLGKVTVATTASRRLLPAQLAMPVGAVVARFPLPSLAPGEVHEQVFVIPTERRGVLDVGPVSSERGDPLGLLARTVRWTVPQQLFVHPATVALSGTTRGLVHDLEGSASGQLAASDTSFHALRAYVPGDDRRQVHWRSTARTGTLMVRQYDESRRSHLVLLLATSAAGYGGDEEFELAVSAAASIALQTLAESQELSVLTTQGRVAAGGATGILDHLSTITTDAPADHDRRASAGAVTSEVLALGRTLARTVPRASSVVLVTGSRSVVADLRRATAWLPAGASALAVTCRPGAPLTVGRIGGLALATVGALSDLPTALRRAVTA